MENNVVHVHNQVYLPPALPNSKIIKEGDWQTGGDLSRPLYMPAACGPELL